MKAINKEYYGDDTRWFVATVIDGSPPRGLEGRVKIRIHGVHSPSTKDIPQKDLPWAQVMMPGDTYGVSGLGTACHIQAGALVFGMFLDGKASQLPFVFGSMPRIEYPTTIQAEGRDDASSNPFSFDFRQSNAETVGPRNETSSVGNVISEIRKVPLSKRPLVSLLIASRHFSFMSPLSLINLIQ